MVLKLKISLVLKDMNYGANLSQQIFFFLILPVASISDMGETLLCGWEVMLSLHLLSHRSFWSKDRLFL